MAGAEVPLGADGVSLWLTDWKVDGGGAWSGRRILALVGGVHAGHLDVFVHPDQQAVGVANLEVEPGFRGQHLASVMMDALYAAYPTAWINHGGRGPQGTLWWDRYDEPAPERNVHNRPPAEWAAYFDAVAVAGQRARNAYQNRYQGVHGHREHVYRYGEALESEARRYMPVFREPDVQGPDPQKDVLHGALRLVLPPGLHRIVHDNRRAPAERAGLLLDHIGYGNLPHASAWSSTEHSAFEELAHDRLFDTPPSLDMDGGTVAARRVALEPALAAAQMRAQQPETHLTFKVRVPDGADLPLHDVKASWVTFVDSPGIEVQLAGLSWRHAQQPWHTHRAVFSPPLDAAIKPEYQRDASASYRSRYSELGDLLPGQGPRRAESTSPFTGREADIRAMAARLHQGVAHRAERHPAELPPSSPAVHVRPDPHQHPRPDGPGIRY
ncbi:hypothetical protein ACF1AB_39155 [Streptomyces sp. NPDC014846]|uniref:hypothetical protein n=1 Tax=Streptomyces sp. NPDC014846 TaxID=3364922 RepID=UPI0036F9B78A